MYSCEPLMNALTMFCELALPTFGGGRLAKGCGHGRGAVFESLASDCSWSNGTKKLSELAAVLLFVEGAVTS